VGVGEEVAVASGEWRVASGKSRGIPHCADCVPLEVVLFLVNPRCRPEGMALQRLTLSRTQGGHPEKRKAGPSLRSG
jgi:hypothetical protein